MMSQLTLNMKNLTTKNLCEVSFKGALVQQWVSQRLINCRVDVKSEEIVCGKLIQAEQLCSLEAEVTRCRG